MTDKLAAEGLVSSPASQKDKEKGHRDGGPEGRPTPDFGPVQSSTMSISRSEWYAVKDSLGLLVALFVYEGQATLFALEFEGATVERLAEVSSPAKPQLDIDAIIRAVAELPDRTSPDDWPDAMLVTADELRAILAEGAASSARTEPRPLRELAEYIAEACNRAMAMLRREGYVFKRFPRNLVEQPPVGDGERWEAMAFSLYSDLAELDAMAVRALNAADDEAEGAVSTAPLGVEGQEKTDV